VLKRIEEQFEISRAGMMKIIKDFHSEMEKGLAGELSSLKMIPTYIEMPTGKEKGEYIALDLGGTNFRVLELDLYGSGKTGAVKMMKFALQKKHMTGTAEDFFDFIATCVGLFLKKHKLSGAGKLDLGFTFSFPIRQTSASSGILMCWTKGFEVSRVVGKDVVKMMDEAFARKGIGNIRISALVNDTVGTLASKSYRDPNCDVGVIIGTGTNACYPEELSKIGKWRGPGNRTGKMVVNIEWGNFNKLKPTSCDKELDERSDNPGRQILEKMVSGMYLGEVTRLVLKEAGLSLKENSFETEYLSIIEADKSRALRKTAGILAKLRPGLKLSAEERSGVKKICEIVSRRAARISASCISAIVTRIDPGVSGRHTIAIDGSVFEKHPTFSKNMRNALREIFGEKASRIKLTLAKDGSGEGAAIIAAVAASA